MKTKKHTNNLQKSSVILLPLSLVLAMLTVYSLIELKTTQASIHQKEIKFNKIDPYDFAQMEEIQVEEQKQEESTQETKQEVSESLEDFTTTEDPEFIEEKLPVIEAEDKNPPSEDIGEFVEVVEPEELDDDKHLMIDFVDEIPIYPGCEKVDISERRACFEKNIKKLVQRKFNSDLAYSLGLPPGKKRISVKFVITKSGEIEILGSRASHARLEKEGERIVKLIPRMVPGKVQGRTVNVSYMLPITFKVD
ncbi:energy transducer TonB [Urechidicola vernalis]|uniref:TonB C-terminal domain-containing protein n=1 Tax=Urechidicola vernalis TaxID=3075600 RepID=A0ABU2Y7J6_9FLAO|nr:energy transducer TonB [Urechidicola sp. P050]MDT0554007.1 hypothetical protein [Urechidicola sp. P050]